MPDVICVSMKIIKHVLLLDWFTCLFIIDSCSEHYLVHASLFDWFTCLLLIGSCFDHYLVHVSPFNWCSCQLICQIIILNFVLTSAPLVHRLPLPSRLRLEAGTLEARSSPHRPHAVTPWPCGPHWWPIDLPSPELQI